MEIPNVGVFFIRNHVAAIRFNDYLVNDTRVDIVIIIYLGCFKEECL
jgi:hypothetical protein